MLSDANILLFLLLATKTGTTITVWDLTKPPRQEYLKSLEAHRCSITKIKKLKDGHIGSYSDDMRVKVWDLTKANGQECVKTLYYGHEDYWTAGFAELPNEIPGYLE